MHKYVIISVNGWLFKVFDFVFGFFHKIEKTHRIIVQVKKNNRYYDMIL